MLLSYLSFHAFKEIPLFDFLTSTVWKPNSYFKPSYGVLSMFVSTFMVTIGALFFAVPIGLATAAYLSNIAGERTREILKPIIEVLAGIPSVVIGFLGIVLIGPFISRIFGLSNGLNALNGSILLGIMALPTIVSISEDALKAVPSSYEDASFALGANSWQTLIRVKIPAAHSGIIASCMLGMGRAIGETMTVLMATGCAPAMPDSFLDSVRTLTSSIAIELGEVPYNSTHYYALFVLALFLFIITLCVNMIADLILRKNKKMYR